MGVDIAAPAAAGSPRQVTAIAESPGGRAEQAATIRVAETGWTMWMVSHFHYDPVWWDTQGEFTESRLLLPGEDGSLPEVRTAFELVALHLDEARRDPDYKFVLAEIDYLKPYLDTHPEDRADLRRFLAEGRVEIVGGNYNEPNTNLTGAESTIRNAVYGLGLPAGRGGRRPAHRVDAGRVRLRPGLPGADGRGRAGRVVLGPGPVPPVGPAAHGRGQHPDADAQRVRVGLPGRPGPAHQLHAEPLRGRLGHPPGRRPGRGRAGGAGPVPRAGPGRRDPRTCCCRWAPTMSSRAAG